MKKTIASLGGVLLVAASVSAQTPDHYRLQFHAASTPDPLSATPLLETPDLPVATVCNQPSVAIPPAARIVVDPTKWGWPDPVNTGRLCITDQGALIKATLPPAGSATVAAYLTTFSAWTGSFESPRTLSIDTFSTTVGPPPPPPPPPPLVFAIGASVQTTDLDNVRSTPAGTLVGTQALGSQGTLIAGPTVAVFNGVSVTWWNVNFTTGVDGWVGEDVLSVVAGVAHPVPTGVGVRP